MNIPLKRVHLLCTFLALLVLYRVSPFFIYPGIHFDSDQATFGLMAIHLSQFKEFPIFMYGQKYMFAVQSWLAAPLFVFLNPSIVLLKFPTLVTNLASVGLLFFIAFKKLKFSAAQSFAICLPLAIPSITLAQQWINVSGGHIEPIFYALAIYLLRNRGIPFALLSALAILHREYCMALVLAIWAILYLEDSKNYFVRFRNWLVPFLATIFGVQFLARYFSPNFVGSAPPFKFNHDLDHSIESLYWIGRHLESILGLGSRTVDTLPVPFQAGSIASAFGIFLLVIPSIILFWNKNRYRKPLNDRTRFAIYLLFSAAFCCGFYELKLQSHDGMLIRYLILTAFIPSAFLVLIFADPHKFFQRAGFAGIALISLVNFMDTGRYWHELNAIQPEDHHQALADFLSARHISSAIAPYWQAYDIDFRTRENLIVASSGQVRIPAYQEFYQSHLANSARVDAPSCLPQEEEVFVGKTRICITAR